MKIRYTDEGLGVYPENAQDRALLKDWRESQYAVIYQTVDGGMGLRFTAEEQYTGIKEGDEFTFDSKVYDAQQLWQEWGDATTNYKNSQRQLNNARREVEQVLSQRNISIFLNVLIVVSALAIKWWWG